MLWSVQDWGNLLDVFSCIIFEVTNDGDSHWQRTSVFFFPPRHVHHRGTVMTQISKHFQNKMFSNFCFTFSVVWLTKFVALWEQHFIVSLTHQSLHWSIHHPNMLTTSTISAIFIPVFYSSWSLHKGPLSFVLCCFASHILSTTVFIKAALSNVTWSYLLLSGHNLYTYIMLLIGIHVSALDYLTQLNCVETRMWSVQNQVHRRLPETSIITVC